MIGATTLEAAMLSSVLLLEDRRRELEEQVLELERKAQMATTRAESRDIQSQIEAHNAALAELRAQQEAERQAEARRAAEAAAKARRARMTGHEAALVDAHQGKLAALDLAERHMAAAVEQINIALQQEAAERAAATAMAVEGNIDTTPLNLSGDETARRIVGGVCSYLTRISACRMRRLAYLTLPEHPHIRAGESWADREEHATGPSVETLLATAEAQKEAA